MASAANSDVEIPDEPSGVGNTPLLVSLLPFVLLVVLYFVFPQYGSLAFQGYPTIVGVPLGMACLFAGLAWGALGVYLVSEAEGYGTAVAAFLTCTLPASVVVALAPLVQSRLALQS